VSNVEPPAVSNVEPPAVSNVEPPAVSMVEPPGASLKRDGVYRVYTFAFLHREAMIDASCLLVSHYV
jgi:hypothetical protein